MAVGSRWGIQIELPLADDSSEEVGTRMDQPYEPPSWFVNSVRILTARSPEFRDFVEVIPNLFLGSHPDGHDPFAIGARVVVCLSSRASVEAAPSD